MSGSPNIDIRVGDCRDILKTLDAGSVQCVVTSPPYFGLRDYGMAGQIGLEPTPAEYVAEMVAVFAEVRRVLADDGTLWLNIGDSYANDGKWGGATSGKHAAALHGSQIGRAKRTTGLAPKNLLGVPWRLAFALQDDGWVLRQEIIWHKPNPMPEAVADRPTRDHEQIFLFAKQSRYLYNAESITEPCSANTHARLSQNVTAQIGSLRANGGTRADRPMKAVGRKRQVAGEGIKANDDFHDKTALLVERRNKRSVWRVPTEAFRGAHFATFPQALIEPCILAGSRVGDTVLDPFGGAGTTGLVADRHSRNALLIELNPQYAELARKRITDDSPLFASVAVSSDGAKE